MASFPKAVITEKRSRSTEMAGPKGSGDPDPPQPERDTWTAATQISVKVGKPLVEMFFPTTDFESQVANSARRGGASPG